MKAISAAHQFSDDQVAKLRGILGTQMPPDSKVVTCGSYARRDASKSSDLDYFCIVPDEQAGDEQPFEAQLREIVKDVVGKPPSKGGAFAQNTSRAQLLSNIGGGSDSNDNITRRILFLLEGDFLTGERAFLETRSELIRKYVENTPGDHQIAFYLLNDIVRYWRTIAVDYAFKTTGADETKAWGVRNLKLVFSRKLIYASGVFSVALTCDRTENKKREILETLFSKTPIERLQYVCGDQECVRLLQMYDFFLTRLDDADFRARMDALRPEDKHNNEEFRELKNEGHYFSRELMGLLTKTFHSSHPIHTALIF